MLYKHWREYWVHHGDTWRWPNFSPMELSCRCCGEYYHDTKTLDAIQSVRNVVGKIVFTSAHRCAEHNERVGGAKRSQHLKLALDIVTAGHDRALLLRALRAAGFTGIGHYQSFIHADMRAKAIEWDGKNFRRGK